MSEKSEKIALIQSKLKAFAIHLGGSAAIIAVYLALVFLVWYPYPYFAIEKVWEVIRIVVGVDVFIGPLLTLVVYRAGKASLKFDMSAIIIVQIAALLWGVSVTYSQRPVYAALVSDNYIFSIVAASDIDSATIVDPELKTSLWTKPKLVYVKLPYSDEEYTRIGKENMAIGRTFAQYSQYYLPIDKVKDVVIEHSVDIQARMKQFDQLKKDVTGLVKMHGGTIDDYIFVSIEGRVSLGFLMLRREDLQVIDALLE